MAIHSELHTIRDFLRYATSRFNQAGLYFGHGTDNAWDEAVGLILHCLHLPSDSGSEVLDARLTQAEKLQILELVDKRVNERLPLAYLTNEAWFSGLSFYIDERVLIPRSSIVELIDNQFSPWITEDKVGNVLDLCTGSGCIAVALSFAFPEAHIDASDISEQALAVAKINVLRHNVEDQVNLIKSDLFESIPEKKYDIIVSNPPYVSAEEMSELPQEYLHEPVLGLESGETGLDLTIKLLENAHRYLSDDGILVVEVGNSDYALAEHFPDVPFTWLEFEESEGGVFLLTAQQVKEYFAGQRSTLPR